MGRSILILLLGGTSFNLLGSGNKRIHQSIINQMQKFEHLDCKTFDDDNREKLADILINSSDAFKNNKKVFFTGSSGAKGIEMAMHLSFQFHKESGNYNKKWFISRDQSYHGATSGALSVGERPNLEFLDHCNPFKKRISECNYVRNKKENETEDSYTDRLIKEFEDTIRDIGAKISVICCRNNDGRFSGRCASNERLLEKNKNNL